MSDDPRSVQQLLGDLARLPIPVEDADVEAQRRERVSAHLRDALGQPAPRSDRRRMLAWALAAAALALLGAGVVWKSTGSAPAMGRMQSATGPIRLNGQLDWDRHGVRPGHTLSLDAGASAVLELPSLASVQLTQLTDTTLTTLGSTEGLWLSRGTVHLTVPKLGQGQQLTVSTPHCVVTVHGTRFSVRVVEDPPSSEVSVTEGLVSVRHSGVEVFLGAGERWSSAGDGASSAAGNLQPAPQITSPPASAPPDQPEAAVSPSSSAGPGTPNATRRAPREAKAAESTLGKENALFRAAVQREKADPRGALRLYDQLLAQYPRSPLAADARVRRFRLLKAMGETAAAAKEARRYMAEHPQGFAQEEARGIAGEPLK